MLELFTLKENDITSCRQIISVMALPPSFLLNSAVAAYPLSVALTKDTASRIEYMVACLSSPPRRTKRELESTQWVFLVM